MCTHKDVCGVCMHKDMHVSKHNKKHVIYFTYMHRARYAYTLFGDELSHEGSDKYTHTCIRFNCYFFAGPGMLTRCLETNCHMSGQTNTHTHVLDLIVISLQAPVCLHAVLETT
jgi:hypothetical protein